MDLTRIVFDLSLYLNSIVKMPNDNHKITSRHLNHVQAIRLGRRMIRKLSIVNVQIAKLIHPNIITVDVLHFNNRRGDLVVHIDCIQVHTAGSGLAIGVVVRVDENYQVVHGF